jgi:hypothetical protein
MAKTTPSTQDMDRKVEEAGLQSPSAQKHEDTEMGTRSPSGEEEYKHEYPEGFRLTLILTAVVLAYMLVYLDLAIMSTATPSITAAFDSLVDIGWYGGAYQLASAAFQPLSGKLYTYFSIKASPYPVLPRGPRRPASPGSMGGVREE